ncbi:HupE/UreJ family protein [Enterovibrio sp. ZSDZ35]|uniref:HupE/UreJ family protein n=1 Tax=Enterovibrio qingdaonensis TaxID=2899818 RepID=A0ABT5QHR4_9GAMM|nr:HupE/UreJ family protein [Enterovibrio sp. ZSDZ35]MDD1780527.1 HupE/UreJ family protein [Enterovibrio sp. ZSDZ35]
MNVRHLLAGLAFIFALPVAAHTLEPSVSSLSPHQYIDGFIHPFTSILHVVTWVAMGVLISQFSSLKSKALVIAGLLSFVFFAIQSSFISNEVSPMFPMLVGALFLAAMSVAMRSAGFGTFSQISAALAFLVIGASSFMHGAHVTSDAFAAGFLVAAVVMLLAGERLGSIFSQEKLSIAMGLSGVLFVLIA